MTRLIAPTTAPIVQLKDVAGNPISFGKGKRTLLTFYRDPACPFCNFHLYFMTSKFKELNALGLDFVAVFSADPAEVKKFILARPRPFPVAAEPSYHAYNIYGIERSFNRKMLAVLRHPIMWIRGMMTVGFSGSLQALGGINTSNNLPADFLINEDGTIAEAYYGKNAADHIPFERVEYFALKGFARNKTSGGTQSPGVKR